MTPQTIDHSTLLKLTEAGAVQSAHVVGKAGGWGISVRYGKKEFALETQRSHQLRLFRKLETLVQYLKGIGIFRFEIDTMNYDPTNPGTVRTRPDSAAKMKSAHEAAAYDKWLKTEIQQAIDDPRPNLNHDDVMRELDERIAAIKAHKA